MKTSRTYLVSLAIMLLLVISCGKFDYHQAIVHIHSTTTNSLCSGTFVSASTIITAAHCVVENNHFKVKAQFGMFETSHVEVHGEESLLDPNDIALLVLDEDVAIRQMGQVLPIAESINDEETVKIVGFGCNNILSKAGVGEQRWGTNQVFEVHDFIDLKTPAQLIANSSKRSILGPGNQAGTCPGDSGGPAIVYRDQQPHIIGVASSYFETDEGFFSRFVNLAKPDNNSFLSEANQQLQLGLFQ